MSRSKAKSRWSDIDGGSAFVIPYTLLRHANFARLSPHGNKLVMDMARQYTGFNNGYLCASMSLMRECGWASAETLYVAIRECEHYGLIERTQQGGRNRPNLHALSWRRIDEPNAKRTPLDVSPTMKPSDAWKTECGPFDMRSARAQLRGVAA